MFPMKKNKLFHIQKTIQKEIGIIHEINIVFNFELEKKDKIVKTFEKKLANKSKNIYNKIKGENKIKVSSVKYLKTYNLISEKEEYKNLNYKIPKIEENYDLNKCINDNINDINSRYLLLEIAPNLL